MFDKVSEALQDLVGIYSQVEAVKLKNQLAKAALSNSNYATPNQMQNAQAKAESLANTPTVSNAVPMLLALAIGGVAVYLLVK